MVTVFLAIREAKDIITLDYALFGLAVESRQVPIQLVLVGSPIVASQWTEILALANKHGFSGQGSLTSILLDVNSELSALLPQSVEKFLLIDAQHVLCAGALHRLATLDFANKDAIFGSARVCRCDFTSGLTIIGKDNSLSGIHELKQLLTTTTSLNYGAAIFSGHFYEREREVIIALMRALDFDGITQRVLSQDRVQLLDFDQPVTEVYFDQTDAELATLSQVQLAFAQQRRINARLQAEKAQLVAEIARLRNQRFWFARAVYQRIKHFFRKTFLGKAI